MASNLSISLAQLNPMMGDLTGNRDKIVQVWEESDSDLIVFSEMILCGYPPEDLVLKPFFLDEIERIVEELTERSKSLTPGILISCPWRIEGKTYNAALLIAGGKIVGTVTKHHLPNYGVFDERRVFEPGEMPEPVEFRGIKLGIMICEDMWEPDVAQNLKNHGAELLIIPNGSPFTTDKHERRIDHAKQRTQETSLPLLYINQTGGQDELVFDGGSFVMDADGNITTQAKFFEEDTISYPSSSPAGILSGGQKIYNALKLGLHDYVEKNNFPGVVLGLSGGIDSALSAVIAVDALGKERVHCIMMPSEFTSQDSLDDAEELANNLGVQLDTVSIEEALNTFENSLKPYLTQDNTGIAHQNIQSRIRGLMLMATSNATGNMVLSTGNKSEMAVGYATLYGDMNGGFNALKDVYKTQVYDLCRWRNEQGAVIPERIITKAPTAELKADQTDQDSLPPYEELDDILHCLIEEEMEIEEIAGKGHNRDTVIKIWRMLDRAEYKRRQAPPGVKITRRAFGRERRYPITNHFSKMIEN